MTETTANALLNPVKAIKPGSIGKLDALTKAKVRVLTHID